MLLGTRNSATCRSSMFAVWGFSGARQAAQRLFPLSRSGPLEVFDIDRSHDSADNTTANTTPTKRPVKTSTLPPIERLHYTNPRTSKSPIVGPLTHFHRHLRQPQSWGIATTETSSHHLHTHADTLPSISRDSRHKRSATGAKRAYYRKKRYA